MTGERRLDAISNQEARSETAEAYGYAPRLIPYDVDPFDQPARPASWDEDTNLPVHCFRLSVLEESKSFIGKSLNALAEKGQLRT